MWRRGALCHPITGTRFADILAVAEPGGVERFADYLRAKPRAYTSSKAIAVAMKQLAEAVIAIRDAEHNRWAPIANAVSAWLAQLDA